jgi:alcohol dehydrogenase
MQMHRQSLTAYGEPLCKTVANIPRPQGSEVLVRIERCGVCHSDLHMQDGYFVLGGEKRLDVRAGRTLPFTLGHEIAGTVQIAGSDASVKSCNQVAVYPWIGCGQCAACKVGDENICSAPRHLGITVDGGFATHVLVPHPRYLIDYAPLSPGYAGALMCSGLTAYAALKRLADRAARAPLLLVGLGGVGLMGLALARAMYGAAPFVADIDAKKRAAALAAGAAEAFDPSDPNARKALLKASGGIYGACDFAGSDASLNFATGVLAKGGKVVVTGLIGGGYTTAVAMFPLKAMTIEGTTTGTLTEARELIDLVRAKNIAPPPIAERPLDQASTTLDDLRAGRIVGRVVLTA